MQQLQKRNELLMIIEGTLFWAGLAFLQGDTVISRFMDLTTGSIALAGLAATLRSVMPMIGQFAMGMFIHKVKKQSRLMTIMGFIDRPLILLMVPVLMAGLEGPAAATMLLVIYAVFFLLDGAVGLLWIEFSTRVLPPRRRGTVIAMQQTFSGLIGFVAGYVLSRVFGGSLDFNGQYMVIFIISGAIFIVDAFCLSKFVDVEHPSEPARPIRNLVLFVRDLIPLFTGDLPVRTVLITRALYMLTLISAPINLAFGRELGHLTDGQLAMLVFMPVIGQTISGMMWSRVCYRYGYITVMVMAEVLGILTAAVNLLCLALAPTGMSLMLPLSIAMVLVAMNMPAQTGFTQQLILFAPVSKRSDYIVMSSIILAPMAFGTYIAGIIVEKFGYLPVYLVMSACGLCGLYIVLKYFVRKSTRFDVSA